MNRPDESGLKAKKGKAPNLFVRFDRHIQSRTLAGLMDLIPLLATIVVILFLVGHADSLVRPLFFVSGTAFDFTGIGIIVLFFLFYFIGIIVAVPPGRKIMDLVTAIIGRTPVVKTIFGVTRQSATALTSQYNFSRVVFVEWPRAGMIAIGFVTGRIYSDDGNRSMAVVYFPTVPNPTSGNMAFVPEGDVIETDLSVEAAVKLVFSGGIVLPEVISLARVPRDPDNDPRGLIGRFEAER